MLREPPRRGGGTAALALVLALLAAAGSGYLLWQQWQQGRISATENANLARVQQRVGTLESSLAALTGERGSLEQRVADAAQGNGALREALATQAERTRHLEDAVATLAEKTLSGRDPLLLDEAESLLRMGAVRYQLFNDAQGAQAAFALADQTLAAVNDGAFSGVRQSISAEREALDKSRPLAQAGALAQLQALRGHLADLPLKPLDQPAPATAQSPWARMGRALAGVITVQRDNGTPLGVADARFARELMALDLAQAQAALLACDRDAYADALQRVDASMSSQFDLADADVRAARANLQQLRLALPPAAPVTLGAALTELRNLRAVHALAPGAAQSAPAPASAASAGSQP
ncbi:MAG: uroporphyrinogen-III C-methyltransferase [Rhodanobacter sp.]